MALGRCLNLSDSEVRVLRDILDIWAEGHEEAREQMVADPSHETPESLLIVTAGLDEDMELVSGIRRRLD